MKRFSYLFLGSLLLAITIVLSQCKPENDICDKPCKLEESLYDKDKDGNYFIRGQIVYSVKKTKPGEDEIIINPKEIVESIRGILKENNKNDPGPIKYQICPCGENILLLDYGNTIGGETTIVSAGNSQEAQTDPGREGKYSLNYLVNNTDEIDKEGIPDAITFSGKDYIGETESISGHKVVAILDSGIDIGFFDDNRGFLFDDTPVCDGDISSSGYNTISHNGDVNDDNGHGSMVALTYKHGLDRLNGNYWSDNQKILNVKVLNQCGYGNSYSISCGLKYAESKGADVINLSLGMYFYDVQIGRVLRDLNSDVLVVCSGGNKGTTLVNTIDGNHYPSGMSGNYRYKVENSISPISIAGLSNVFEVFSLERSVMDDCVSGALNFGKAGFSCYRSGGFAEPGISVEDLLPSSSNVEGCPIEGTSFSAPLFTASTMRYLINGVPPINIRNRAIYNSNPLVSVTGVHAVEADWMERCASGPVENNENVDRR